MTDHDDRDTEVEPTEQASSPAAEQPLAQHAEPADAEFPDDDAETESARSRNWYIRVGTLTLVATFLGFTLIPLLSALFTSGGSKQVAPEVKPSMNVPANTPPPVARNAPPAATPAPGFSAYDQKFLSLMTQEGWGCTDNSSTEQCTKQLVNFAHEICSYAGQPIDSIYREVHLPAFLGPSEERMAIAKAEQAYPNCTFTGSP